MTESAKAAGLVAVHEAPTLDPKLAHIMPQVASMGAAVSVVDIDRDGLPDLYVTNSREDRRIGCIAIAATARSKRSPRSWALPI